ncbi:farnesyl-diphosphate farnesyltransferase [Spinellus fusiger]|nr:farnesyl-diphosphate farnesyltransferase [Spinellus fusiger]
MASAYLNSIAHPNELSALLTYTFAKKSTNRTRHENTIAMDPSKERCYHFLNKTSRSFAAVIQELDDALRDAVCLFYLVLRGLDTIEDDMSLPVERKVDLLRSFDKIIFQKGWTFHENGPNEKDRHLLVEFDCVIQEFLRLKPGFQRVIADITHKMGHGMADYALGEHRENTSVATIADFDLYCYYVAGLVGHGLSELFVESGLEDAPVAMNKKEANDMGLFLQKTNIIRDYREDLDEKRQFWPKEIWGKYVDRFEDLILPENKEKAYTCLSSMVLNVLDTMPSVLSYLSNLRSPSVFNFAAIPQVMAIATLALVFNNLDIYHKNIKIRKGEAIRLILDCTDIHSVIRIFRQYTQVISQKNDPKDPNFLGISMAIGKVRTQQVLLVLIFSLF